MARFATLITTLLCLLYTVSCTINLNRGGTCLTGSIGEFIVTVDYVAGNGDEKTTTYSVPESASLSSNCASDSQGQTATVKLQFGRDVIELKFATSGNVIGRPIYLKRIEYNYVRDSRRFPLLLREDTQRMFTTFSDGDASFGVTGKHFKCTKMSLVLPNGIKFELRNLMIGLFKTRDLFGEISCSGATHHVTEAPSSPHNHRTTPRSPTWGHQTSATREPHGRITQSPTDFVLPIRFQQDRCVVGNAVVSLTVPYTDRQQQRKTSVFKMPSTAGVVMSCSERSLRTKHAWVQFRWAEDVLNMEFTAPAVSGKQLSLVNANYTVKHDSQRFPGGDGGVHTVAQTFTPGTVKVGEWHKFFSCPKFTVDFGSGVIAEFHNLRLALFGTPAEAEVATCATP